MFVLYIVPQLTQQGLISVLLSRAVSGPHTHHQRKSQPRSSMIYTWFIQLIIRCLEGGIELLFSTRACPTFVNPYNFFAMEICAPQEIYFHYFFFPLVFITVVFETLSPTSSQDPSKVPPPYKSGKSQAFGPRTALRNWALNGKRNF